jgi:hypothetical protein
LDVDFFSFDEYNLTFFGLTQLFWLLYPKFGQFFSQSSGHPVLKQFAEMCDFNFVELSFPVHPLSSVAFYSIFVE